MHGVRERRKFNMELKKAIKCLDGTYVEGTADHLADICYRYDKDFSDENIAEIEEFAKAMKDTDSANKMHWLLESRHELAAGKMNLGQMKIDLANGTVTEAIQEDNMNIEVFRENDKVVISITGWDDEGTYTATNAYELSEFLDLEEGSLELEIGHALAYGINYLEK